jgi:hypothetical protein
MRTISDKKLNGLMLFGMLFIALSGFTRFLPRLVHVSDDTLDATKGFVIGFAIGLLLLSIILRARRRVIH